MTASHSCEDRCHSRCRRRPHCPADAIQRVRAHRCCVGTGVKAAYPLACCAFCVITETPGTKDRIASATPLSGRESASCGLVRSILEPGYQELLLQERSSRSFVIRRFAPGYAFRTTAIPSSGSTSPLPHHATATKRQGTAPASNSV